MLARSDPRPSQPARNQAVLRVSPLGWYRALLLRNPACHLLMTAGPAVLNGQLRQANKHS